MGTDLRIKRDPLAMRMREDQIKQSKLTKFLFFSPLFFLFNFLHTMS